MSKENKLTFAPNHEPICMARKPLAEKNVANNVLKWGTGGLNIDGTRVQGLSDKELNWTPQRQSTKPDIDMGGMRIGQEQSMFNPTGRFPANLIHDGSDEVRECFPETKSGAMNGTYKNTMMKGEPGIRDGKEIHLHQEASSGNASRFFKSILYYPKASKKERNMGCEGLNGEYKLLKNQQIAQVKRGEHPVGATFAKNHHPTVKPIALMEYLIKMVTPKGGTVLDPFMGSGSTGVAARKNGYDFIGIDMTPEYVEIAKARINAWEEDKQKKLV